MKLTYTELLQLVEDHMAKKLARIDAVEAKQAEIEARVAALEAAGAPADYQTQIDALKAGLAEVAASLNDTDAALGAERV